MVVAIPHGESERFIAVSVHHDNVRLRDIRLDRQVCERPILRNIERCRAIGEIHCHVIDQGNRGAVHFEFGQVEGDCANRLADCKE